MVTEVGGPNNLRVVERLVGRHGELGALVDVLSSARSGRGRGLLLLGDAGIGKTTLAEALAAEATGCTVGWGRCPEAEALPYAPWRQALRAGIRDLATLLSHPRTPVHVLDLMGDGPSAGGGTGPVLDQQARTAYRGCSKLAGLEAAAGSSGGDAACS